jgi:hypothetical protein
VSMDKLVTGRESPPQVCYPSWKPKRRESQVHVHPSHFYALGKEEEPGFKLISRLGSNLTLLINFFARLDQGNF